MTSPIKGTLEVLRGASFFGNIKGDPYQIVVNNNYIAKVDAAECGAYKEEQNKDIAHFIVKACNNHDDLIKALEMAKYALCVEEGELGGNEVDIIDKVLAKVKE